MLDAIEAQIMRCIDVSSSTLKEEGKLVNVTYVIDELSKKINQLNGRIDQAAMREQLEKDGLIPKRH
jgi:hypothetical protein